MQLRSAHLLAALLGMAKLAFADASAPLYAPVGMLGERPSVVFSGTIDPQTRALLKLHLMAQSNQEADLAVVFDHLFLALASNHPLAPELVQAWGRRAGPLLLPQAELRLNELKRVEQEVTSLMTVYAQDLGEAGQKHRLGKLTLKSLVKAEDSRRVLQAYAWDLAHIRRDIEVLETMRRLLRLKP
ncbi:MAG: hypothetical protein ACK5PQ_00205 [Alphaproteobacteria bacterium]